MSRKSKRFKRQSEKAVSEVSEFIEDNPVTSALGALAAGALVTTMFKMNMDRHTQRSERVAAAKESKENDSESKKD